MLTFSCDLRARRPPELWIVYCYIEVSKLRSLVDFRTYIAVSRETLVTLGLRDIIDIAGGDFVTSTIRICPQN